MKSSGMLWGEKCKSDWDLHDIYNELKYPGHISNVVPPEISKGKFNLRMKIVVTKSCRSQLFGHFLPSNLHRESLNYNWLVIFNSLLTNVNLASFWLRGFADAVLGTAYFHEISGIQSFSMKLVEFKACQRNLWKSLQCVH